MVFGPGRHRKTLILIAVESAPRPQKAWRRRHSNQQRGRAGVGRWPEIADRLGRAKKGGHRPDLTQRQQAQQAEESRKRDPDKTGAQQATGAADRGQRRNGKIAALAEQDKPSMPLSCRPASCPWPSAQAKALNSTLKYRIRASRGRRVGFMPATLAARPGAAKHPDVATATGSCAICRLRTPVYCTQHATIRRPSTNSG